MLFNRRNKKKGIDLEAQLIKKMNQRLRSSQLYIHKVGLLCWLGHGFHLNVQINDSEVLSTAMSLVPQAKCPEGRVDLKYLEQFTKWFKKIIKVEFNKEDVGVTKEILLDRISKKTAFNHRELVLIYIATLRAIGLNCRLVLSLCPPVMKLRRDQMFQLPDKSKDEEKEVKKESKVKKESETKVKNAKKSPQKLKKGQSRKRTKSQDQEDSKSSPIKIIPENSTAGDAVAKDVAKKKAVAVFLSKFSRAPAKKSIAEIHHKSTESEEETSVESTPIVRRLRSKTGPIASCRTPPRDSRPSKNAKATLNLKKIPQRAGKKVEEIAPVSTRVERIERTESDESYIGTNSDSESSSEEFSPPKKQKLSVVASKSTLTSKSSKSKQSATKPSKDAEVTDLKQSSSKTSKTTLNLKKIPQRSSKKETVASTSAKVETTPSDQSYIDTDSESSSSEYFSPPKKLKVSSKTSKTPKSKSGIKVESNKSQTEIKSKPSAKSKSDPKPSTSRKSSIDRRVLSSDDEDQIIDKIDARDSRYLWAEVYVESEESWISVSVPDEKIHCVSEIYKKIPRPVLYVVGWNSSGTLKDVTRRYCPHWLTDTRKQRIEEKWWKESTAPWAERETVMSRAEDEMLLQKELEQPLPKTLSECKSHPLYVVQRHLLKFEGLYPPDCAPLGHLKTGDAIYSRHCVHTLRSRETWHKEARVVKPASEAYKIVKALPKWDKV